MSEPTPAFASEAVPEMESAGGYLYISDRLVHNVLTMPKVANGVHAKLLLRELKVSLAPRVAGGEATFERETPTDYTPGRGIREKAAAFATDALRRLGLVGSMFDPPGQHDYVQLRMDGWLSPVMVHDGFIDTSDRRVALFGASHRLDDGRRALVVLIGSEHNLMTGAGAPVIGGLGRNPSDMDGLYALFDDVREQADGRPTAEQIARDTKNGQDWLIQGAANMFSQQSKPSRLRPVVALARAHAWEPDVDLGPALGKYDVVVVGAALWIREVDRGPRVAPPLADVLGAANVQEFNRLRLGVFEALDKADATNWERILLSEQLQEHQRHIALYENALARVATREEWVKAGIVARGELPDVAPDPDLVAAATRAKERVEPLVQRIAALSVRNAAELDAADKAWHGALVECSRKEVWPQFAKWYALQAHHEGQQPYVYMTVERKSSAVGSLVHNVPREWSDRTDIAGLIVFLRDKVPEYAPQTGQYVLVTQDGDIYQVVVDDGLRFPPGLGRRRVDVEIRAPRFVYDPDDGDRVLRRRQEPQPNSSLRLRVAEEMFVSALNARREPHPFPTEPWANNPWLLFRPEGDTYLALAPFVPQSGWRPAVLNAFALPAVEEPEPDELGTIDGEDGEAV